MQWLRTSAEGFENAFARIVRNRRESDTQVGRDVANMINEVRERGDDALVDYTGIERASLLRQLVLKEALETLGVADLSLSTVPQQAS